MTDTCDDPRLSLTDPFEAAQRARADRRRIVRRWIATRRPARPVASVPAQSVLTLAPLAAGYMLSYLFRNVNGVVAPDLMRDLGIGADTLGLLTAVYFLAFAAAQLPIGVLLDRMGPRPVQAALFLLTAAGAVLCGTQSGLAGMLLGRAMIGVGTAGALVAGLKASAALFPGRLLAWVNGLFIMCGGIGALGATWPVESALHVVDWRGLFLLLGAVSCLIAASVWLFLPRRQTGPRPSASALRLADVVRDPTFRRFAPLSASCFGAVLAVQGLWAGPFLAEVNGLSRQEVASDLGTMAVVLIVAAPLWGVLTSRLRSRVRLTRVALAAALLLMAAEALLLAPNAPAQLSVWCLFAAFGGMTVLSYSIVADLFPTEAIGRANGVLNVLHIGASFAIQLGIGTVVALWPAEAGHYPAAAYRAGLLLPLAVQSLAVLWFAWPRQAAPVRPRA